MSLLKALINPVTPFEQNAPIIYCENTKKCAFVDPGGDIDKLLRIAKEFDLIPEKILLTHGHADHAGGADAPPSSKKARLAAKGAPSGAQPEVRALDLSATLKLEVPM